MARASSADRAVMRKAARVSAEGWSKIMERVGASRAAMQCAMRAGSGVVGSTRWARRRTLATNSLIDSVVRR